MAFRETLTALMPTFFPPAAKSGEFKSASAFPNGLPMPTSGGRTFWWGNGGGPIFPGGGLNVGRSIDYAQAAGDVAQNSAVAACLNWIGTNWADAPPKIGRMTGGKFGPVDAHPAETLLNQPNEDFNGKWLMWALLQDYFRCGNAYAHVVRVGTEPRELQYLPASCVSPVADAKGRLSHYAYKPKQTSIPVDPALIVHFRFGVNPDFILSGVSPLGPVLVEIVSDNACARYPANVMHHGGLPPAVLTPKAQAVGTNMQPLTPEMAATLTEMFNDKRESDPGKIRLIPAPLDLVPLGWKPSEMALNDLREEPETRIAAQFGLPCIVVGLRAGMIRSTYSNTEQAVKAAWTNCLVPLQKTFAAEWTRQLLPLFPGSAGLVMQYDHSGVGVLQDDKVVKRQEARADYQGGLLTHDEARSEQGRPPLKEGEKDGLRGGDSPDVGDTDEGDDDGSKRNGAKKGFKAAEVEWITVNGRHIPIGEDGKISIGGKPAGAEATPTPSQKSMLAKQSAKYVGADIQRYSEEHNEPILAKGVSVGGSKGLSLRDNEPVDVITTKGGRITGGIELKTMVDNKANKITMKGSAMERKAKWSEENAAPYHTVVFDDHAAYDASGQGKHDDSKRQMFYKRGFGSFRVSSMHPVKDVGELNSLLGMTDAELPAGAKPPKSYTSPVAQAV